MLYSVDCEQLKTFYETPLGMHVQQALYAAIRSFWPQTKGQRILGVGYAGPFLEPYVNEAQLVALLAPQRFGAFPWPHPEANRVTLADPSSFPFSGGSFDKILVIHALEGNEPFPFQPLLEECARTLVPGGKVLVCAANGTGSWSHLDKTPFGKGQCFTSRRLMRALQMCDLTPLHVKYSLFMPPVNSRFLLNLSPQIEPWSNGPLRKMSGVVLVEAQQLMYSPLCPKVTAYPRRLVPTPA